MMARYHFYRNQVNLSLKDMCSWLLDALDKKLLFQTLHGRPFLLSLSREPHFFQYLIPYIFFCYCIHCNILEDAESIRLIQEVHHIWGKCPEFIFCLKSCWWLLLSTKVSASTKKHQWYPLPLLPSDCNKNSCIFPHKGAIRHESICWTINKGDARTFNVVTMTCFNIFISHTPAMWIYHLQILWHFLRVLWQFFRYTKLNLFVKFLWYFLWNE